MSDHGYDRAEALLAESRSLDALRVADEALADSPSERRWLLMRLRALIALGRFESALDFARMTAGRHPAEARFAEIRDSLETSVEPPVTSRPTTVRSWESSIPPDVSRQVQKSIQAYRYRGLQMVKTPFDIALYLRLITEVKPGTVIEIGSKEGGSAVFFGDLLVVNGGDGSIVSFDVFPVEDVRHPRVSFRFGDGQRLNDVVSEEELASWSHPWVVIEDADHSSATTQSVLEFFDAHLIPGDWMVIEDAALSNIFPDLFADGISGPERALRAFLAQNGSRYRIASEYCDFFGYNATANVNGYLEFVG